MAGLALALVLLLTVIIEWGSGHPTASLQLDVSDEETWDLGAYAVQQLNEYGYSGLVFELEEVVKGLQRDTSAEVNLERHVYKPSWGWSEESCDGMLEFGKASRPVRSYAVVDRSVDLRLRLLARQGRVREGVLRLGSSKANSKTAMVPFSAPFIVAPTVELAIINECCGDEFEVRASEVTPQGFEAVVVRTDSNEGWGQELELTYVAKVAPSGGNEATDAGIPVVVEVTVSEDVQGHRAVTAFRMPPLPQLSEHQLEGDEDSDAAGLGLDVMSVNIWNYNHWQRRKQVLADELLRLAPDVIGFQEVRARKQSPNARSRYQVKDLLELLPNYQWVYQPAMGFQESSQEFVHEGLAIFSRLPIVSTSYIRLSQDHSDSGDFHTRVCLSAIIDTPIGLVNFLTTHLSLSEQSRNRTLPEIGEWAAQSPYPTVLVGDMNVVFDSKNNVLTRSYGFHDAWLSVHGTQLPEEAAWTFNAWEEKSRIDYVLVKGCRASAISVEGKQGVHMGPLKAVGGVRDMKQTMMPSDHFFLHARISGL